MAPAWHPAGDRRALESILHPSGARFADRPSARGAAARLASQRRANGAPRSADRAFAATGREPRGAPAPSAGAARGGGGLDPVRAAGVLRKAAPAPESEPVGRCLQRIVL